MRSKPAIENQRSPLGYWVFDSGSGKVINYADPRYYMEAVGSVPSVAAHSGRAVATDGSSTYLRTVVDAQGGQITDSASSTTAFTSLMYIKLYTTTDGVMCGSAQDGGGTRQCTFWTGNGANNMRLVLSEGPNYSIAYAAESLTVGKWYTVVFVSRAANAGGFEIYIDGSKSALTITNNDTISNPYTPDQPWCIGARKLSSGVYNHVQLDVAVHAFWSYALDPGTIRALSFDPFLPIRNRQPYNRFMYSAGGLLKQPSMDGLSGRYFNPAMTGGL